MLEDTIGILLSKREWDNLKRMKSENKSCFYYAKKGEEHNLVVVFFPITNVSITEGMTEAIVIKNNTVIRQGKVDIPTIIYNPTKFNRKKNIKILRELSLHPNIHVINEHHVLKKKYVFEILQSHSELRKCVNNEIELTNSFFTFYLLGQKNMSQQWDVSILYAKGLDEKKFASEEAYRLINDDSLAHEDIKELLNNLSQKILSMIHYYYPGIYEIGLQFIVNSNCEISLKSFCTKKSIEKDLIEWNEELWEKIMRWPIELAHEMKLKTKDMEAISVESELDDSESYSFLNQYTSRSEKQKLFKYMDQTERRVWVKLNTFKDEEMIIKVPSGIIKPNLNQLIELQFGTKKETCVYFIKEEAAFLRNNSYEYPIEISVSTSLLEKMHIPLCLIYQLNISRGKVIIGPTIGLLLGDKNQIYNPQYMEKFSDRFGEYEKIGGLVIAFSPRSIDWNEEIVYGLIYDPEQKKWKYDSSPIPSTLYRRNFHQNIKSIEKLIEATDKQLFNSYHFKKSDLLLLQEEPQINNYLPETHILKDMDHLTDFINTKQKIILKPVSLSRGRGIFIIEKNKDENEGYILYDYRKKYRVRHLLSDPIALHELLESFNIQKQDYLYQTYIPLLKVNERPFDVRIVMQKYELNKWKCSGIECRVAGENEELTNIARGGKAMTLEDAIYESGKNLSFPKINKEILLVCHKFCELMDKKGEHYAEFGLDIALDEKGYPWLLEANIFPSFKGFREMDYEMYLNMRYQPLYYAAHLQEFDVIEREGEFDEVYNQSRL